MRIVVYQDYLRVGGTEAQSIYLSRKLSDQGHEVILLTNRPDGPLKDRLSGSKVRVEHLQSRDFGLNWYAPKLKKRLATLEPEVILLMGRNANCQGYRIRDWFPGIRLVASMRTGRKITWMYRKTLRVASLVVCNSEFAKKQLLDTKLTKQQVEVHPNGCLRHSEILGWEREGSHRSRERDVFVLLYVAAFVQGKNHRDVLELANLLQKMGKEFRIRLIGEGPEKEKIEREVEARDLASLIELVGFQNHLADHFFKADLAISTSFEESMPNALVEAQYSGLPVVAYDVAGVRETFVDGGSGILVERGNLEKMVESIEILMADSQRRSKMSEVALKFSRKKFDPEIRFDEFSRSLLNQHTS